MRLADFPEDVRSTAELLVSELVTNAVKYGQPPLWLLVELRPGLIHASVSDTSTALPQRREAAPDAEGGRGLLVLEALAGSWGTVTAESGKYLWFDLPVPVLTPSIVGRRLSEDQSAGTHKGLSADDSPSDSGYPSAAPAVPADQPTVTGDTAEPDAPLPGEGSSGSRRLGGDSITGDGPSGQDGGAGKTTTRLARSAHLRAAPPFTMPPVPDMGSTSAAAPCASRPIRTTTISWPKATR